VIGNDDETIRFVLSYKAQEEEEKKGGSKEDGKDEGGGKANTEEAQRSLCGRKPRARQDHSCALLSDGTMVVFGGALARPMGSEELGDTHLLDVDFGHRVLLAGKQSGPEAVRLMLEGDGEDEAEEEEEEEEDDDDEDAWIEQLMDSMQNEGDSDEEGQFVRLPNGAVVPAALLMQLMQNEGDSDEDGAGAGAGEEG
jgi:hypothetical protein